MKGERKNEREKDCKKRKSKLEEIGNKRIVEGTLGVAQEQFLS